MKSKNKKNTDIKLLLENSRTFPLPRTSARTDDKILSLIRGNTRKPGAKPAEKGKLRSFLRYNPAIAAAMIILAAGIASLTLLLTRVPAAPQEHVPYTFLQNGNVMTSETSCKTGTDEYSIIKQEESVGIQLFPDSEFTLLEGGPPAGGTFRLEKGSVYINKHAPDNAKSSFTVYIYNYAFTLTGTRVYLDLDKSGTISASCYDGKVMVTGKALQKPEQLPGGYKLTIEASGSISRQPADSPAEHELNIDKAVGFAVPVPGPVPVPDSEETAFGTAPNSQLPKERIPPWQIKQIGILTEKTYPNPGGQSLLGYCESGGKYYLASAYSLTILQDGKLIPVFTLTDDECLKYGPADAGKYICLVSDRRIYLLEKSSGKVSRSIPVPPKALISNTPPCEYKGFLYISAVSKGYYRLNLADSSSILELYMEEAFPLSPTIENGILYAGSFYDNYISAYSVEGKQIWKYQAEELVLDDFSVGRKAVSLLLTEKETEKTKIIMIKNGRKEKEWLLPSWPRTRLKQCGIYICWINMEGELVSLNTETGVYGGKIKVRAREQIRNKYPDPVIAAIDNLLYCGTSDGKLVIYNLRKGKIVKTVTVNSSEKFLTMPIVTEDAVYLCAESARVYRLTGTGSTKNDI